MRSSKIVQALGLLLVVVGLLTLVGCSTADKQDSFPVTSSEKQGVGFASGNPIISVIKQNVIEAESVERLLQVLLGTKDEASSSAALAAMAPEERALLATNMMKQFAQLYKDNNPHATISVGSSAGELSVAQSQGIEATGAVQGDTTQTPTTDVKVTPSVAVGPGASASSASSEEGAATSTSTPTPPAPAPAPMTPTPPTPAPDPVSRGGDDDQVAQLIGVRTAARILWSLWGPRFLMP